MKPRFAFHIFVVDARFSVGRPLAVSIHNNRDPHLHERCHMKLRVTLALMRLLSRAFLWILDKLVGWWDGRR
jgi:hypothetical protein